MGPAGHVSRLTLIYTGVSTHGMGGSETREMMTGDSRDRGVGEEGKL